MLPTVSQKQIIVGILPLGFVAAPNIGCCLTPKSQANSLQSLIVGVENGRAIFGRVAMYLPSHFDQPDNPRLHEFIRENDFGVLIQRGPEAEVLVNHLPFLLEVQGEQVVLQTHVARNNPLWRAAEGSPATVVFQGPHAYISPRAYQEKSVSGKVVPTWNYAVVHARGSMHVQQSQGWLMRFLERLSQRHEAQFGAEAWSIHEAPSDYLATLSKAIVGIEIPVTQLQGKWKLSQNRNALDRAAIVQLLKSARPVPPWQAHNELALAELMS